MSRYTTIGLYLGTIGHQGSIDYEFNDFCEPAVFMTGLSSEDPGISQTAQNFSADHKVLVKADLGYSSFLNDVDLS